ncbi:uncharacterized protein [Vicugna pacos]|uniref:Uncharacterized protein isoform X1 n=1 Tax=Vicugna pacos TaxID=30538 RepID=A0ABM5C8U5_VICPA
MGGRTDAGTHPELPAARREPGAPGPAPEEEGGLGTGPPLAVEPSAAAAAGQELVSLKPGKAAVLVATHFSEQIETVIKKFQPQPGYRGAARPGVLPPPRRKHSASAGSPRAPAPWPQPGPTPLTSGLWYVRAWPVPARPACETLAGPQARMMGQASAPGFLWIFLLLLLLRLLPGHEVCVTVEADVGPSCALHWCRASSWVLVGGR